MCHSRFNLHSSDDIQHRALFHTVICSMCVFFGEVFNIFCPSFFHSVVCFLKFSEFFVYFDNSSLSDTSFANLFSQPVICLLTLLTGSIAEKSTFILQFQHTFAVASEKSSSYRKSSRFSLMLPSGSFIVLYLTFRFIIHLN